MALKAKRVRRDGEPSSTSSHPVALVARLLHHDGVDGMVFKAVAAALAVGLAGCAGTTGLSTARGMKPDLVVASDKPIDDAASCVVAALAEAQKPIHGHGTHAIQIVEPGKIYEVHPQQRASAVDEQYFVRITAEPGARTRLELYEIPTWFGHYKPFVARCGKPNPGATE